MSVGAENIPFTGVANDFGNIRTMTYNDLKSVIAIEIQSYTHPWTIGIFRDCLRVGYSSWAVERDKMIIAYGIVMLAAGEAHILNLCIHPEFQHKGLGRRLLDFLSEKARQSDIEMILLEVRRSNHIAIELYQSEGFHELGVRNNYYPADKGREDAIIFARYLKPNS